VRKPWRVSGQRRVAMLFAVSLLFAPSGLIWKADIIVFVALSELWLPSSPARQSSSAPEVPSSALHRALAELSSSLSQPSWPGFARFHGRLRVQSKCARDFRPPLRTGCEKCVEVTSGHHYLYHHTLVITYPPTSPRLVRCLFFFKIIIFIVFLQLQYYIVSHFFGIIIIKIV